MEQTIFEKKIKPIFLYIGIIATVTFGIAYIVCIAVMIIGLETHPTIETFVGFLIANIIAGACIAVSLMIQGQDFAKALPKNKEVLEAYFKRKDVKLHSMTYYWVMAIIKLILTRLLLVAAMTYIVIDICWQGNNQYTYFLMAVFNLLMFFGFGSLGMVSMYDKFNTRYIPWILQQQAKKNEEENKKKGEKDTCSSTEIKNLETSRNKLAKTKRTSSVSKPA